MRPETHFKDDLHPIRTEVDKVTDGLNQMLPLQTQATFAILTAIHFAEVALASMRQSDPESDNAGNLMEMLREAVLDKQNKITKSLN